MPKLNMIDEQIFEIACDRQLDAKEHVYGWFHKEIDGTLKPRSLKHMDRSELIDLEVTIAMLHRLSSYFTNTFTTKSDVVRWRDAALAFFDHESQDAGDADQADITNWRSNISANFSRLENVLPRDSD